MQSLGLWKPENPGKIQQERTTHDGNFLYEIYGEYQTGLTLVGLSHNDVGLVSYALVNDSELQDIFNISEQLQED